MQAHRIALFLVPLVLSVAPLATQERGGPAPAEQGPLVLGQAELVLDQYGVQHVDAQELYRLAEELVGRTYFVKENGGTSGNGLSSLRLLGDTIVLYDTREQVQRARELLARLDVAPKPAESSWRTLEYRPHFVSLGAAAQAADSLAVGVSQLVDRGLIVLSGEGAAIEQAQALLKRIDVPEKQVFLTCQLLEVSDAAGQALPRDLADNLQKLLPQSQFVQTGMAMLRTSAGERGPISVRIETAERDYRLSVTPIAFDEASGSLTVSECSLTAEQPERELFRTNTVLRGGEYTVLGATGATPKLLVVRVVPQG